MCIYVNVSEANRQSYCMLNDDDADDDDEPHMNMYSNAAKNQLKGT